MSHANVEAAIAAIAEGKMVIVTDDEDRENEGDLIMAASKVTEETIAFIVKHTSGVLTVPLKGNRLDALELPMMVQENTEAHRTAFTISVDYKHGTSTGISAADRARTIRALADESCPAEHFTRPGHVFPLRYREGGVLKRAGHTEAAVDLAELAGLYPAGVICEIVDETGDMARGKTLRDFAAEHDLPMISIASLIRYRYQHEKLVQAVSQARLPTRFGEFSVHVYEDLLTGTHHLALVHGEVRGKENVLVRVHSECLTGDILGSLRCDCGNQLHLALQNIASSEGGVLLYLRGQEGRGIGLAHKIRAYDLQDQGFDTVEANLKLGLPVDTREYGIGAQILCDLGITTMRLMTNNPHKYGGLAGYNLSISERVPLLTDPNTENAHYLKTKAEKLGHIFGEDSHLLETVAFAGDQP